MTIQRKVFIDGIIQPKNSRLFFGWENSKDALKSPRNFAMLKNRVRINNSCSKQFKNLQLPFDFRYSMDGIRTASNQTMIVSTFRDHSNNQHVDMCETLKERYKNLTTFFRDILRGSLPRFNFVHVWNFSIVASIIFGMFLMTMIYRYLGRSASAGTVEIDMRPEKKAITEEIIPTSQDIENQRIMEKENEERAKLLENHKSKLQQSVSDQSEGDKERELKKMLKGYPIEKMIPYIVEKDKKVAAFLVGIAKKESNWGKYSPKIKNEDCFNYWGYKSIKGEDSAGDYACFDNPKEAVDIVGKRMETFIKKKNMTDPGKMVTAWKCGYDCSWDSPGAVKKWVSDVKMYYDEVMEME